MQGLHLKHEKLNVNGGAIAMGHPLGASGCRIVLALIHALRQSGGKRGFATACWVAVWLPQLNLKYEFRA